MAVYTIFSESPQPDLRAEIESQYPDSFYHWNPNVSFVRAEGTARSVAAKLGIKHRDDDGNVNGRFEGAFIMMASPSYFGWSKATLWEWLKSSMEAEG